ncbi:MAG: ATP-binding cassette domain-containing protein [Bacteroidota bacterium]
MQVSFHQVSKRYNYDWIFKNVDYQFNASQSYALTGPNGSGKSTLLKVLSGHLSPSKGKVEFVEGGKKIAVDEVYRRMSFAAPYIELIEELTLLEALHFHERFKPFRQGLRPKDLLDFLAFSKAKDKQVRHFSSGMKQRLKLALAFCSETPLLLLDEPTTNLDKQGIVWYRQLVERFAAGRLVVVASNVEVDFDFCEQQLSILDYK